MRIELNEGIFNNKKSKIEKNFRSLDNEYKKVYDIPKINIAGLDCYYEANITNSENGCEITVGIYKRDKYPLEAIICVDGAILDQDKWVHDDEHPFNDPNLVYWESDSYIMPEESKELVTIANEVLNIVKNNINEYMACDVIWRELYNFEKN